MDRFEPVQKPLEALEKGASPTLKLVFPTQAVVDKAGKHLTPAEATGEPRLYAKTGTLNKDGKYMCVVLDPDAPFPSFPLLGPILHGLQTDLVLDTETTTASTEWTRLTSVIPPLMAYRAPGPPRMSAPHRYVSILWQQPDAMDVAATIKKRLGWGDEPGGLWSRVRFDVNVVVEALGLSDVVTISYFTSSSS